ncbi:hypothetical protein EB796_012651 [Bugula neritina]|uniref:KIAA0895 n=1 Tax=Bugula neritina TaxID=10212 RepID=A0A7J7JTR9_BUGNE|nr:hypothetical protein EB796_012651 [Bugula neritina]
MATIANTDNRLPSRRKKQKANTIRVVDETPTKYTGSIYPTNLLQQQERFLTYGILPQFMLRASVSKVEAIANKPLGKISHKYLQNAIKILNLVKEKYTSGDEYFQQAFGDRIDIKSASAYLNQYLNSNGLDGHINIVFSSDLDCSARMMWHGPHVKQNRPEARKHTLIIKNSADNFYLREQGIICLANHEIGTHYLRSLNDGLQPWYADRKKFGLRSTRGYHFRKTEEGLAALNTVLQAKSRYLYGPALLYYIACMAESMTFKELFHHLEEYVYDPQRRWHYVMRVKRHLPDPNDLGGLGKDQCYFEGAMEILQGIDDLELPLIYSGTLCNDETSRVKRLARLDCLKLPSFLDDIDNYRHQLRWIGYINGILPKPPMRKVKHKKINSKLSLSISSGGRPTNSRQLAKRSKTISAFDVPQTPTNLVLIHDTEERVHNSPPLTETNTEVEAEGLLPITMAAVNDRREGTASKKSPTETNGCILEKIQSRLSFHDDLIKRVESKLTCASLSLRQSEKLMLNGLQGKTGLATSILPPVAQFCSSPIPPVSTSLTIMPRNGSSGSLDSGAKHSGNFSVQSRPPTLQSADKSVRNQSDWL